MYGCLMTQLTLMQAALAYINDNWPLVCVSVLSISGSVNLLLLQVMMMMMIRLLMTLLLFAWS